MAKASDAFRTIGEVSDELDVPKHVLRFWEGKFPQLKPMKRGGGRRFYRPEDVTLLRGIHHLLHGAGYTIKGVQRILRESGVEAVKNAAPDGATLLLTPYSCTSIYPHIYKKLSYDPFKDLTPISIAAVMHHGLAVGPMVPASVKTVKDYVAWAKANPGQASYGSPAAGSTPHFLGALLSGYTNTPLTHVPYRGSIPGVADVIAGQLASMFTPSGDFMANHKAGKLRILATSGPTRNPFSLDVPTFAEQGFAELTTEEWFGFYAPAKTPDNIIDNANAAINAALLDKAVINALGSFALISRGSSAREMDKSQRDAYFRWGPLVKQIGFSEDS